MATEAADAFFLDDVQPWHQFVIRKRESPFADLDIADGLAVDDKITCDEAFERVAQQFDLVADICAMSRLHAQ